MVRISDILQRPEEEGKSEESFFDKIEKKSFEEDLNKGKKPDAKDEIATKSAFNPEDFLKKWEEEDKSYREYTQNISELNINGEGNKSREDEYSEEDATRLYNKARGTILDIMDLSKGGSRITDKEIETLFPIAEEFMKCIAASKKLYLKAIYTKRMEEDFISHSINVAISSIKIGEGLKYDKEKMVHLTTAAFVHDIGMTMIPFHVIHSDRTLTEAEFDEIKKHPLFGKELLSKVSKLYHWLPLAVSQEHERVTGGGYPLGLKGDNIHEYAKIIGMMDDYEALTHERKRRRRFLPYDAIKIIVESKRGQFDKKLLKILLKKISVFPLNNFVELNTGEIGVVIDTTEEKTLRPTVKLLYDNEKNKLETGIVISLEENPFLYIVKSVYEEDVEKNK